MEWNTARLKFAVLTQSTSDPKPVTQTAPTIVSPFEGRSFVELCQLGLALTWPLAAVALLALGVLVAVLLTR
jgi:hypothetical protein